MRELPQCYHRGDQDISGRFACSSNMLIRNRGTVSRKTCEECPYADIPDLETVNGLLGKPRRRQREGKCGCSELPPKRSTKDIKWACGVTMCSRNIDVQAASTNSLHAAGWDNVIASVEPGTSHVAKFGTKWFEHDGDSGGFSNFINLLSLLLDLFPDADAIHCVQDDTIFAAGCREYLDQALWPSVNTGCVSLYTASHYADYPSENGWINLSKHNRKDHGVWGACSLIFPRYIAEELVRNGRQRKRKAGIDIWVSRQIIYQMKLDYWCASPSLAQHIGYDSPMKHGAATGKRRAADFSPKEAFIIQTGVSLDNSRHFREQAVRREAIKKRRNIPRRKSRRL
jgi:hypothetical protein